MNLCFVPRCEEDICETIFHSRNTGVTWKPSQENVLTKEPRNDERKLLHCYGKQLWFNCCLPGTLMNRYILRMRGQNTRTRYLIHVELAKNTGPPDSRYERVLQLSGNRKRFPCLHSLMWTREGLGEFETVMQTRDEVEGVDNCREFYQPLECLYQAMQTPEKRFLLLL